MINRKTVFILGAGASRNLDFEVGNELVSKIIKDLADENSNLFRNVVSLHGNAREVRTFHEDIISARPPTIDLFLSDKSDEFTRIGKMCIAQILIPHEKPEKLKPLDEKHWYNHLLGKIYATTPEKFKKNNITFLTFNYDRSLEQFFCNTFKGMFGFTEQEVVEQFTELVKIIHIYGQLGDFLPGENRREYLPKANETDFHKCVDSIKLMHEVGDSEHLRDAQQLIQEAEVVCFLGFGYHQSNLDQLFSGINWPDFHASIYGSAMGIDEGYRGEIYYYFMRDTKEHTLIRPKITPKILGLGGIDDNILDFFNKNSVLTDKDNDDVFKHIINPTTRPFS